MMEILNDFNMTACVAVFILITLDLATGIFKALYRGTFSSGKMRQGLWHKFAIVVVLFVAWMINNSYTALGLPESFDTILPVANMAISIMEISSIAENLGEINPELKKLVFWKTLRGEDDEDNNKKGEK